MAKFYIRHIELFNVMGDIPGIGAIVGLAKIIFAIIGSARGTETESKLWREIAAKAAIGDVLTLGVGSLLTDLFATCLRPKEETTIKSSTKTSEKLSFDDLIQKSAEFPMKSPNSSNLLVNFATTDQLRKEVVEHAQGTRPILHNKTVRLMEEFLKYKTTNGSQKEKDLYAKMTVPEFITRLLCKRPLAFFGGNDHCLLRDGETQGLSGFDVIGTDADDGTGALTLGEYLSYDEIQIAALVGMSVPTHFINDGSRFNMGMLGQDGQYEKKGVYVGLVGARFERPELMEYQHMFVTEAQNTVKNGYGNPDNAKFKHWTEFYDIDHFPTCEEVEKNSLNFALTSHGYLNLEVYKKRLQMVIEPFLFDANHRAKEKGKMAYVHAVGLGLGVWAVDECAQAFVMLNVYAELIKENNFENIADIDFSWFPEECNRHEVVKAAAKKKNIAIHFSRRNPAAKLEENKLLVASYAWDGNSFPGNEYWIRKWRASGDPAAACCSFISELQNPYINSGNVHGSKAQPYGILPQNEI